jgi:RHS repeat-associated protein
MRVLYDGLSFEVIREGETYTDGSFRTRYGNGGVQTNENRGTEGSRYRWIGEGTNGVRTRETGEGAYSESAARWTGTKVTLYGKGEAVSISVIGSGTVYLGKDVLGSVRSTTGGYGTLEDRYEYDAFGNPYLGDLESGMDLGYTGKPYDTATGLYDYGYRDYSPATARFTTTDPVRDGTNWFAYVNNDPVNWIDLWGLLPGDVFSSELDAIKDFSMTYNDDSIRNNREYSSSVFSFRSQKTGEYLYSYTVPNRGSSSKSTPSLPFGGGVNIDSYIHTHGAYANNAKTSEQQYDYNIPSPSDQSFAFQNDKTIYTVGPAGAVNKFDPAINTGGYDGGTFISGEWNNIPKDPRDVVNPDNTNTVDLRSSQSDDPYQTNNIWFDLLNRDNIIDRNDTKKNR